MEDPATRWLSYIRFARLSRLLSAYSKTPPRSLARMSSLPFGASFLNLTGDRHDPSSHPIVRTRHAACARLFSRLAGLRRQRLRNRARKPPTPLEGVWESVITAQDCTTQAVTGSFIGSQVFHHGGHDERHQRQPADDARTGLRHLGQVGCYLHREISLLRVRRDRRRHRRHHASAAP